MALSQQDFQKISELSIEGEMENHSIDQFCLTYPDMTEEEAYQIQILRNSIMESRGAKIVGYKLGGTSLAKINQLKETIYSNSAAAAKTNLISYGCLMDYMLIGINDHLNIHSKIHPKIEPEFAFVMGDDLEGNDVTVADVISATDIVVPAFEIIDSRFHNFKIGRRCDAIADNTSASGFKLGEGGVDPKKVDLNNIGMKLKLNQEFVGFGAGSSIMGHPARAVAELVHCLAKVGKGLKKGDIVLSGAVVASIPVKAGDKLTAIFGEMGEISIEVRGE